MRIEFDTTVEYIDLAASQYVTTKNRQIRDAQVRRDHKTFRRMVNRLDDYLASLGNHRVVQSMGQQIIFLPVAKD